MSGERKVKPTELGWKLYGSSLRMPLQSAIITDISNVLGNSHD